MAPGEIAKIVHYHRKQSAGVGKTVIYYIEKGKETVQLNTLLKVLEILNIRMKFETPLALPKEDNSKGAPVSLTMPLAKKFMNLMYSLPFLKACYPKALCLKPYYVNTR